MTSAPQVRLFVQSVFYYEDSGAEWTPADQECFGLPGMVFAGPEPEGAVDAFDFVLCTPRWLAHQFDVGRVRGFGGRWLADGQVLLGRGLILVQRWDRAVVERAVREAFGRVSGPTWSHAADRAGRDIPWEFDYRHDAELDRQT